MKSNRLGKMKKCELQGCRSTGAAKTSVGRFQVYDGDMKTMNRPAHLCATCVELARSFGMTPKKE